MIETPSSDGSTKAKKYSSLRKGFSYYYTVLIISTTCSVESLGHTSSAPVTWSTLVMGFLFAFALTFPVSFKFAVMCL